MSKGMPSVSLTTATPYLLIQNMQSMARATLPEFHMIMLLVSLRTRSQSTCKVKVEPLLARLSPCLRMLDSR